MTTLGDLRKTYSAVHKDFNSTKFNLAVQRNELNDKIKNTENGKQLWGEKAAILELQYNAVSEKQKEYDDFISQVMKLWDAKRQEVVSKQNADATEKQYEELQKIMTVAIRMCRGDIVPASDEKKLMEADADLYQMAKNAQMMAQNRDRKKYESLWEDEEKTEYEDPIEVADSVETTIQGPEVVSAESVMEAGGQSVSCDDVF